MIRPGPALVLAPLGVGGHVDHVLTRTAAENSEARTSSTIATSPTTSGIWS